MRQFLMLVGVAAVAGAMYVAGASGSQQAKFASEKQVVALEKRVTALTKSLKNVKFEADAATTLIGDCYLIDSASGANFAQLPVTQFGGSGPGFLFGTDSSSATPRTALDVDMGATPEAHLQVINPSCLANGGLRHSAVHSASNRIQHWFERAH
jgi:hypothetical protein